MTPALGKERPAPSPPPPRPAASRCLIGTASPPRQPPPPGPRSPLCAAAQTPPARDGDRGSRSPSPGRPWPWLHPHPRTRLRCPGFRLRRTGTSVASANGALQQRLPPSAGMPWFTHQADRDLLRRLLPPGDGDDERRRRPGSPSAAWPRASLTLCASVTPVRWRRRLMRAREVSRSPTTSAPAWPRSARLGCFPAEVRGGSRDELAMITPMANNHLIGLAAP